jgi:hypothetical protein
MERMATHNSTYPKVAVQWVNQALCLYESLCLVDSLVLRNRHLRVAANRCASYKSPTHIGTFGFLPTHKSNAKKPKEPILPMLEGLTSLQNLYNSITKFEQKMWTY